MLRRPLTTELTAATSAAAKAGLGVVTPHVLHLGDHTTVRLAPWPIVARIASGTSFDFSRESLARELAVACHLASRGAPSVRPTTTPAPGPYLSSPLRGSPKAREMRPEATKCELWQKSRLVARLSSTGHLERPLAT
jgi:hypothetical protein